MKITVIGGGPGGLYFSILTKKAMPHCQIDIYERNKPDDSFGFGVVFSDETLGEFLKRDMQSYELIRSKFAYWDDIIVARDGESVNIAGNGFCGCSRKTLLQLLQQRCIEEGVNLHFEQNVDDLSQFADSDIILASDGIASVIRTQYQKEFGTKIELKKNRFVWLGSTKPLDAFTYFFRSTPYGTIVAHSYQYEEGMSTWIFECSDETWQKHGFEVTNEEDTMIKIAEIFKEELDGHPLISNKSHWRQFPHVTNEKWYHNNIVLLGDAAHAIVPFYGQGMNCGFEDCTVFNEMYDESKGDWSGLLGRFSDQRVPDANAILDLALDNYVEMRDKTADPEFLLQKKIEGKFSRLHPDKWTPLYSQVTFSNTRYSDAVRNGKKQDALMQEILKIENIHERWDEPFVMEKMLELIS